VYQLIRRVGALLIAAAIVALIVYDLANGRGFSDWWDEHAITTSLVSDLLIVGATALIFDEVQAYRQRKDRSLSVAAQGLIVYSQAREAYQAVVANVSDPPPATASRTNCATWPATCWWPRRACSTTRTPGTSCCSSTG
jgi:hypothetical protein